MAKKSQPTFQKREKEKARRQKMQAKQMRRLEAKEQRASDQRRLAGEDPSLAGIRPGPQPLPAQWDYLGRQPEAVADGTEETF